LSSYVWEPLKKTQASDYSIVIHDDSQNENEIVKVFLFNFNHLWGKNNLHTVVFDFDDTLIDTYKIQISAWVETILKLNSLGEIEEKYFSKELKEKINSKDNLKKYVEKVFDEKQFARSIFETLFPKLPEEISKKYWELVENMRFEKRQALTLKKAKPFPHALEVLKYLKGKYQLVIISSTSEGLIQAFLQKHNLLEYFSFILGKEGPILKWTEIQYKAKLMIKLSKMIGISLGRMVYIGDNNADYLSSKQLNISFIEARFKSTSLITYDPQDEQVYFTEYSENNFSNLIDRIERRIRNSELELSTSYLQHFFISDETAVS
jgi:phosphoglycolate phosphatase